VFLISDLCEMLEEYLEHNQVKDVYNAYLFGAEAHKGQHRLSGEPYIYHPIAVAQILAEQRMDHKTIIAAILHDVIEDTPTVKENISEMFGEDVAELVDGVSKLTQIQFETKAEQQAENIRKMMLAMTRDIRVILIKLADRLHNMRTLGHMRPDKKRRIARETLDIYVPIASRLGMNTLRIELEELGFKSMYPMRYAVLLGALKKARGNRKEIVSKIETAIKRRLFQEDLIGDVIGREKHLYSIYEKIKNRVSSLSEVFDIYAFRIVVDSVDGCYRTLGVMHNLYKPVPGKFKDYIAIPKTNGYQSLHTVLFGPYGVPIEVQIRTREMHTVAENGIAAHWRYKTGEAVGSTDHVRAREWLRNILEMQKSAGDSLEFIENLKIDLFPDEIYVFTPKGKIMEMPRGATAVDFAYAVHTDIGNSCVAVKIDRRLAPLRTPLWNGQRVEIVTAPNARPNPAWLNFVITAKARSNIRHFLKNIQHDEAVQLGQRLMDKALSIFGTEFKDIPKRRLNKLLKQYGFKKPDELLADVGLGLRMAQLVARALMPEETAMTESSAGEPGSPTLTIKGTEGMLVNFAKCCHPIPGDAIVGFLSSGRGIVVHIESCKNVGDFRKHPEKWIDVQWEDEIEGEFQVALRVEVSNQRGSLATIAAAIADKGANIENVEMEEREGKYSTMNFILSVKDRHHLAQIMRHIHTNKKVMRIVRK